VVLGSEIANKIKKASAGNITMEIKENSMKNQSIIRYVRFQD